MFKGNGNGSSTGRAESNSPDRLNRIVEGTNIQGEIKSDSNIRIDGRVIGTITTKGKLVLGATGFIEGEVICASADIEGTITGKITVDQLLSLKSTAKINGDILTGKLAIEPGAVFTGSCGMGGVVKEMAKSSAKEEAAEQTA